MSPSSDPTQRFKGRVENYDKYRPLYPRDVLELLEMECGLTGTSVVADVGSGTGILSELFLANGNRVLGVEPNREMRGAAERRLRRHPPLHERRRDCGGHDARRRQRGLRRGGPGVPLVRPPAGPD
jgi:predicted RNA methylase